MHPEFLGYVMVGLLVTGLVAVLVEGLVKDAGLFAVRLADRYADQVARARAGYTA